MSIRIAVDDLDTIAATRPGPVYALTVRDGAPRACSVDPSIAGGWACQLGSTTAAGLRPGDPISLLWGTPDAEGYTLIVDAHILTAAGHRVALEPVEAVLHQTRR